MQKIIKKDDLRTRSVSNDVQFKRGSLEYQPIKVKTNKKIKIDIVSTVYLATTPATSTK